VGANTLGRKTSRKRLPHWGGFGGGGSKSSGVSRGKDKGISLQREGKLERRGECFVALPGRS